MIEQARGPMRGTAKIEPESRAAACRGGVQPRDSTETMAAKLGGDIALSAQRQDGAGSDSQTPTRRLCTLEDPENHPAPTRPSDCNRRNTLKRLRRCSGQRQGGVVQITTFQSSLIARTYTDARVASIT